MTEDADRLVAEAAESLRSGDVEAAVARLLDALSVEERADSHELLADIAVDAEVAGSTLSLRSLLSPSLASGPRVGRDVELQV